MSWEHYINANGYAESYDDVLEYVVSLFPDTIKDRSQDQCDVKQYIILWWNDNKKKFNKYTSTTRIANLFKFDNHTSVLHYIYRRIPTYNYEENIRKVKNIINYETQEPRKSA
jgi:hypothetical protein